MTNITQRPRQLAARCRFEETLEVCRQFQEETGVKFREDSDPETWLQWQHLLYQATQAFNEWGRTGVRVFGEPNIGNVADPLSEWTDNAGFPHHFRGYDPGRFVDKPK